MAKSKRARLNKMLPIVLTALVALSILLVLVMRRNPGYVSFGENMVGSVVAPVQSAISSVVDGARTMVANYQNRRFLEDQNAQYKRQLELAEMELERVNELARENDALREMLSVKERYESLNPIYAKVVGKDEGIWFDTFMINRGSADGILPGMAVIDVNGLVGQVTEVGDAFAKVLSIVDGRSKVGGVVERTRNTGLMRGQLSAGANQDLLRMYFLPEVNDVMPGDRVLTSGQDGRFPGGLPVGDVFEVTRQSDDAQRYITITPLADFLTLTDVMVLRQVVSTIETDPLPKLPNPTPTFNSEYLMTPTPAAGPSTPAPSAQPGGIGPGDIPVDAFENYTQTSPPPQSEGPGPSLTPEPTPQPDPLPEDAWADR